MRSLAPSRRWAIAALAIPLALPVLAAHGAGVPYRPDDAAPTATVGYGGAPPVVTLSPGVAVVTMAVPSTTPSTPAPTPSPTITVWPGGAPPVVTVPPYVITVAVPSTTPSTPPPTPSPTPARAGSPPASQQTPTPAFIAPGAPSDTPSPVLVLTATPGQASTPVAPAATIPFPSPTPAAASASPFSSRGVAAPLPRSSRSATLTTAGVRLTLTVTRGVAGHAASDMAVVRLQNTTRSGILIARSCGGNPWIERPGQVGSRGPSLARGAAVCRDGVPSILPPGRTLQVTLRIPPNTGSIRAVVDLLRQARIVRVATPIVQLPLP